MAPFDFSVMYKITPFSNCALKMEDLKITTAFFQVLWLNWQSS